MKSDKLTQLKEPLDFIHFYRVANKDLENHRQSRTDIETGVLNQGEGD